MQQKGSLFVWLVVGADLLREKITNNDSADLFERKVLLLGG
jgi:hypothetical protein